MNKNLRTAIVLAVFACAALLLIAPASAQSVYGSIFGTVTDKTGAAVSGATITVKDEAKGTVVNVTSNAAGDYSVPHLIPDVYDLRVTAKGFKTFETKGISVEADTAPRIDPTLEVGGGTETIEVSADAQPELKTDRADVSTVFDQQQVSSLPVGDQNFTNLQLLLPGAQLLGWSHAADENPQGSKQIQVDGQAFGGTAFELDGTDNQDPILGIIVINPAMDAVTETKITTQNFDAELGKAVSAVVTAQTRSGTNNLHGSAYDFRTGNANLARDPFNQYSDDYAKAHGLQSSIPPGLKNRFGGSIGGPIVIPHVINGKDKAFFFFNYEAQRQKVGTAASDTLPTNLATETCLGNQADSQGGTGCDFSQYLALNTSTAKGNGIIYDQTKLDPVTNDPTPFPNNIIPRSYIGTAATNPALKFWSLLEPYTKGVSTLDSNYHSSGTGLFNSDQWTERVDYALSERMHAFERFSRFTDTLTGKVMFGAAGGPGFGINNYGGNSKGANDSVASGMDIAVNPKLLTDFRLGYYRYNVIDSKYDQGQPFANTLGINNINLGDYFTSGSPGFQMDTVPGGNTQPQYGAGLGINRCNCPLTEREDQYQVVNNWTRIIGNHSVKVGADLRYGRNLRVPSDTDRAGLLQFSGGPTSDPNINGEIGKGDYTSGGLGFATFALQDVTHFGRFVGNAQYHEQNAKEFQKRTFFYAQDTWRATKNLTLNLGVRWEIYFPETVNGAGRGALLNMKDGYLHIAGIGGIGSNLGWGISPAKMFAPRIGLAYQLDPKTVIRAGYGRSFDTGVFGSIFGHTVTQNLPVLGNQQLSSATTLGNVFVLNSADGPGNPANSNGPGSTTPFFPAVPSNGLLPNPGYSVNASSRHDSLNFPAIDAWNLSVQRALTPTLTLTLAYVGNKGTHTLGDGDSNGTNPAEAGLSLPGSYSVNGQTLHWDSTVPGGQIAKDGGTSTYNFLSRYYGGSLPACKDANYKTPTNEPYITAGMCGWTSGISYRGDDQNTEFDALQITLAKSMTKGLATTLNYQWAAAFDENSGYYTWSHKVTHGRDSNVRTQQLTAYGSYDTPFGKGKQYMANANRLTDLLVGGYQLSWVLNWSGGLPFSLSSSECYEEVGGTGAPCYANASGRMKTHLTKFQAGGNGTGTRTFYDAQSLGGGIFSKPGLDTIGNVGRNTYFGPQFFNTDLAVTKAFTVYENVVAKFRADAFNAFNHINAGNPGGYVESTGNITGQGAGGSPRQLEFSFRLQF
ncbi:MAG: TonB-dependent receptor [Terracidiphilus sp.]